MTSLCASSLGSARDSARSSSAHEQWPTSIAMRIVLFCHSLLSDWNHGNAHFLRGVVTELQSRGHDVRAYEPVDAWSAANLAADHGPAALERAMAVYPGLAITRYDPVSLDLDALLDGAQ